jgi:hypothetical protein
MLRERSHLQSRTEGDGYSEFTLIRRRERSRMVQDLCDIASNRPQERAMVMNTAVKVEDRNQRSTRKEREKSHIAYA